MTEEPPKAEVVQIPVVHKGMVYRMEKGKCSFCSKKSRTIKRMAKDHQICDECVYLCDIANEKYTAGTIICKGCKNWKEFKFFEVSGGLIHFKCLGIDAESQMVYSPATSTITLTEELRPLKSIQCVECLRSVPTWFLKHNTYLQQFFKEFTNVRTTNSFNTSS